MEGAKNLTQGGILYQLFHLSMPIIFTSFIQMAYNLTDTAWVGHLNNESVAAVGAAGIIIWFSNALSLLTKVGAEVTVGQSVGVQDSVAAKSFASHNVTISMLISLIWTISVFLFAPAIINLFELDDIISSIAVSYLRIVALGFPFYFVATSFIGVFNGSGNTKTPLIISGLGLVMNMLLDPLFIFVFKLGANGAAIATLISEIVVFIAFVVEIFYKKTLLGGFSFFEKLELHKVKKIIHIGLPVALLNAVYSSINFILGRMASIQGGHIGLLTQTIGGHIEAVSWNTSQGFSSALSSFVSQNYAARKYRRVKRSFTTTLAITCIVGIATTTAFVFFGRNVFSWFVPEQQAFLSGGNYLRISGYSQLFMMLEITSQGLFYGMGKSLPPAIISITLNMMRIPIAMLLISFGMGVDGIWWAISISCFLKSVLALSWIAILWKKELSTHAMPES